MSGTVFKDNVFPHQLSDIMSLMHLATFEGSDGEEHWQTYLTHKQKECIALSLGMYYQCEHCIDYHMKVLNRLGHIKKDIFMKNMTSMVLFLRVDVSRISEREKIRWMEAWQEFATKVALKSGDPSVPYLIGLAIGIARDDDFLIQFCGAEVKKIFDTQQVNSSLVIGELEAVVVFMKAATSKNRIAHKIAQLIHQD